MDKYDVIIIGAGPGGIFSAYELVKLRDNLKIGIFEAGSCLEERKCPIDGDKVKSCVRCKSCGIMNGFGGAGAFSAAHCMSISEKTRRRSLWSTWTESI